MSTSLPSGGLPCWDPWIVKEKDSYRLFYLSGHTDDDPWWKTSWICSARSVDGARWQHAGPALMPLEGTGWESGRLFAGSAYYAEGVTYLFYSAASRNDITEEAIGLAIASSDNQWQRQQSPLLSFKDATEVFTRQGVGYAGRCNWSNHLHWRDPYVLRVASSEETISEENKYYLFFCASLTSPDLTESERFQGGLGLAIADQLSGPYRLLPPAAGPGISASAVKPTNSDHVPSLAEAEIWPFYHLERPQVIFFQGKYHLFFSCFKAFINPLWLKQVGKHNVTDSTLYWYVADSVTGPFHPSSELPVVPGSESTGLYGTTFYPMADQDFSSDSWLKRSRLEEGNRLDRDRPENSEIASVEMAVVGWYSKTYQLAVKREFKAVWTARSLQIMSLENSQ